MPATYDATRLMFRAEYIEALSDEDWFEVQTPEGTFRMTRAQFYDVFENVVRSKSYSIEGLYHYPTVPQKAYQFKLT